MGNLKTSWIWAVALGSSGFTAAAADTVRLLPSPIELPARIGPLVHDGAPHKYDDPRLGMSYQYNGQGLSLTIYIYNAGVADIPDGGDTIPTCREFEDAKRGVAEAGYENMVLESEQLVRLAPPDDLPRAREALFEFERDKHPTISYLWITGVSKNFVKLRFSVDARLRDELVDARRAVLSTLGAALEPHLKLVVPKAENPGVSMAFDAAGSDEAMAMGLMYLMLLTTIANESPAQLPVCGGEFVPTYSNELAAFQGAFVDGPSGDSKFGKRIAAVSKAGFLEEFVWVERHRGAWGVTPPKGLTLAEYESWRKKKLKRLRIPDFGSVVIDHPRPLPVEPPAP